MLDLSDVHWDLLEEALVLEQDAGATLDSGHIALLALADTSSRVALARTRLEQNTAAWEQIFNDAIADALAEE